MKNLLVYILLCSWAFAFLDWKVIQLTRFTRPEWKEWMHAHERAYAGVLYPLEWVLCAPALAFKPLFLDALIHVEATDSQQAAITHAPPLDWRGLYRPIVRGEPYVFISWDSWFLYHLGPSLIWWWIMKRFFKSGVGSWQII